MNQYHDTEGDSQRTYQIVRVPTAFYLNSDHILIRLSEDQKILIQS